MTDRREYYTTHEWKERRAICLEDAEHQCQIPHCESRATIAHHLNYDSFGEEAPQDLQAVCRSCHDKIHERDERQPETSAIWTGIYHTNDAGERKLMSLYPGFTVDHYSRRKLFSETPDEVLNSYFRQGDFVFHFDKPLDWQAATKQARDVLHLGRRANTQ